MYVQDVRNHISLLFMNTTPVLLVHRVRDPSERQKDRQRTGLLHVAISHAANPMFARVRETNNVIGTTPTAKPGLNSHQPTSVSGSTVTGLNPG